MSFGPAEGRFTLVTSAVLPLPCPKRPISAVHRLPRPLEGEKEAVNRAGQPEPFGDRFLWNVATGTRPEPVFPANMRSERWRGRHGFHSRGGTVSWL